MEVKKFILFIYSKPPIFADFEGEICWQNTLLISGGFPGLAPDPKYGFIDANEPFYPPLSGGLRQP